MHIHHPNEAPKDALANALLELKTTKQELSTLYYAVSHDLNAPVRSILGFSKALNEDFGETIPSDAKEFLSRIVLNAVKLESMIGDLLALSRVSQVPIQLETVDLSTLVYNVFSMYRQQHPSRRTRTVIENGVSVVGDRKLLTEAVKHMVDNSWKFSCLETPLEICFGIDRKGPAVTCFLKDNGIGFDMAFADKLFSPFQRLHSGTKYSGSGIGLAMIHRIIRRLGGRTWADAHPNLGATLYFVLPPDNRTGETP